MHTRFQSIPSKIEIVGTKGGLLQSKITARRYVYVCVYACMRMCVITARRYVYACVFVCVYACMRMCAFVTRNRRYVHMCVFA